tara:strand:- start:154 stop:1470 length:1317 start_codon:yes stop_codon:yes gene_type:complete
MSKNKIRYLHLSNDLYPIVTGGTELFIHELIKCQLKDQDQYEIIWAAHKSSHSSKDHFPEANLTSNQRLLPAIVHGNRIERFSTKAKDITGFISLLEDFRPDVVHFHSFSTRCGLNHAHAVKESGAKLVLTMHAPVCSCMGNLLYANDRICNGVLNNQRCTYFRLKSIGIPRFISMLISMQNGWPLKAISKGNLSKILTSRQLTTSLHNSWLEIAEMADHIHVLASWSQRMLLNQGLNKEKIHLIRTAGPETLPPKIRLPMNDGVLRLVYWGRCNPEKGIHLLVDAICSLPRGTPIQLDLYGPYWDNKYAKKLLSRIKDDDRFNMLGTFPKDQLLPKLQNYDLAVIPSIWMETGPLTVLEAFASGLPVAGSDLGGIRELIRDVPGCFLVQLKSKNWLDLFKRIINNPSLISSPKLPKARTFDEIAAEIKKYIINPHTN